MNNFEKNEMAMVAVEKEINKLGLTTIHKPKTSKIGAPILFVEFGDGSRRKVHYKYSAKDTNFRNDGEQPSAEDLVGLFIEDREGLQMIKLLEATEVLDLEYTDNLYFNHLIGIHTTILKKEEVTE